MCSRSLPLYIIYSEALNSESKSILLMFEFELGLPLHTCGSSFAFAPYDSTNISKFAPHLSGKAQQPHSAMGSRSAAGSSVPLIQAAEMDGTSSLATAASSTAKVRGHTHITNLELERPIV